MSEIIHNKLVRDRIPEIVASAGKQAVTRVLSEEEYIAELDRKLDEECAEYHADRSLEELADVLYAIAAARGHTVEELEQVRAAKAEKRGAFADRVFLEKVVE